MLATLAAIRVAARDGEAEHLWHRTNNRWFEFYIPKKTINCFEFPILTWHSGFIEGDEQAAHRRDMKYCEIT